MNTKKLGNIGEAKTLASPKNNQKDSIRMYSDYLLSVETLQEASKAISYDEEKVQTTTAKAM